MGMGMGMELLKKIAVFFGKVKSHYTETPVHGRFRFLPWWFWFCVHVLMVGAIAFKLAKICFSAL